MKKILLPFVLILFIGLTACGDFDKEDLENRQGKVRVIGHAGSGFVSWWPFNPMAANSMSSFEQALENGADGLEVDVHMTSDHEFILYHDDRLESKTNLKGCPSAYTLAELEGIAYKPGFPFNLFGDNHLIGLDSLIKRLRQEDEFPELHLDLRNHSDCEDEEWDREWEMKMILRLKEKLKELKLPKEKLLIISYSRKMLNKASKINFPARISFEIVGDVEEGIKWAQKQGVNSLTIKPSLLNKELSKELHQKGFEVITFGAKSKSGSLKLLKLNPDAIQSNNVPALKALLSD